MLAGIRDILIISTPEDTPRFEKLFGDGSHLGLRFFYAVQERPGGLAQAFLVGESFIGQSPVALILGDNIFYGQDLMESLQEGMRLRSGGLIFGYRVKDPQRYGVVQFDEFGEVIDIEEKPSIPKSSYAVPGLYFYGPEVVEIARSLKPSLRGEVEITDVNRHYLREKKLRVRLLGAGLAWLDTGTFDAFQKASLFVQAIQERQGIQIACLEEIAYSLGYINKDALERLAECYAKNEYGDYLHSILLKSLALFPGNSYTP